MRRPAGHFDAPRVRRWRAAGALALAFLVIGWWPFNPLPASRASFGGDPPGLRFSPPSLAYDSQPLPSADAPPDGRAGFTLELWLASARASTRGVTQILTIDDGRTPPALVVGQWRSELLLRVPAPAPRRRFRETAARLLQPRQARVVVVTGDASGTQFYADGTLIEESRRVWSPGMLRGRLVLADAPDGHAGWDGTVYGVAVLGRPVSASEASAHADAWHRGDLQALARERSLLALYRFDRRGPEPAVRDLSPRGHRLEVPARYSVLRRTWFEYPGISFPLGWSMLGDVVLNLAGFVPFGVLAFIAVSGASHGRLPGAAAALAAVALGAALSLTIEAGQAFLPTRNSTAADLVLNTGGTVAGAAVAWLATARRRRTTAADAPGGYSPSSKT